jgi:ketosteroid isomerase-like protein
MHTSKIFPTMRSVVLSTVNVLVFALAGAWPVYAADSAPSLRDQVFATERAFAKSMADRNLAAFAEFIAEESIFFNWQEEPSRGKKQVVKEWEPYFKETAAPFSWEPDQVEVLASGTLALSTGPVRDPAGKVFARFNSIWRLEGPNTWRIVFDKGSPASPGPR